MTQLLLDITPQWVPSLDNFVPGRNVELLSALRHALAGDSSERCFYLWGEPGCGKSHLLQAAVRQARAAGQRDPGILDEFYLARRGGNRSILV